MERANILRSCQSFEESSKRSGSLPDLAKQINDMATEPFSTYPLGDFSLKNGGLIPDARIAYKSFGKAGNPAIIYPT